MPIVFRYKGNRFFFYSNEGEPLEPLHVHVRKGESVAKFWLEGEVGIAESYGFSSQELNDLFKIAIKNRKTIKRYWDEHFGA
jgi:hypothetical protein